MKQKNRKRNEMTVAVFSKNDGFRLFEDSTRHSSIHFSIGSLSFRKELLETL